MRMKVTDVVLQSPCNQLLQSCLANQLYDYYNADLARIAAGTTPLYMVSRWGGGNPNAQQVSPPLLQTKQDYSPFPGHVHVEDTAQSPHPRCLPAILADLDATAAA